ncbi:hypothetical protein BDW74DRAFT_158861 [Aspergillus multicolor]|uniref:uncharacterized protein n=1 Tax=Aspergillus multicolor TaxID=41759 RepID=UPI003CCD96D1
MIKLNYTCDQHKKNVRKESILHQNRQRSAISTRRAEAKRSEKEDKKKYVKRREEVGRG